jgi:hypothetical protein
MRLKTLLAGFAIALLAVPTVLAQPTRTRHPAPTSACAGSSLNLVTSFSGAVAAAPKISATGNSLTVNVTSAPKAVTRRSLVGNSVTVAVGSRTSILRNGHAISLSALTAGAHVSVTARTCLAALRSGASPLGIATLIVERR